MLTAPSTLTADSSLLEIGSVWDQRTLGTEELSRDVESLATDNNDLLAIKELLGDRGGQATEKVALSVNDNDRLEGRHGRIPDRSIPCDKRLSVSAVLLQM